MKKIDKLEFWEEEIYTMTKTEALEVLKNEGITESEQMLLRWCRSGEIEAVRIVGEAINKRGVLIDHRSLKSFITTRKGVMEVERLYIQLAQFERENSELKARVRFLEDKYINKKK